MKDRADPRLVKRCSIFASAAAVFSVMVGLSVLAGWTLHIASLLTWGRGLTMAPNAAACSVLAGISLWLLRKTDDRGVGLGRKLAANTTAAIAALTGLLSLAESIFRLDLGIDRVLLAAPPTLETATTRIRMSPVAAGDFFLFGIALLLIDWRTRHSDWPAQFLSIGAALGAAFGLIGLLVGPSVSPITIAFPAAIAYFALASGIVCARASWAIGGLLTSPAQGARLLRKVVPAALLVLGLIGFLISKPLLTEAHFTWVEASLLAVFSSALLAGFIAWMAFIVERGEAQRKKLEEALHVDKEHLDRLLDRIEEPQAEVKLRRKVKLGFAFAIVLTSLLGFLSWRMAQHAAEDADWVTHTREVSATLEATLRHLVDVETGGRGFALTGSEPFLQPYEAGKYAVGQDLLALRLLVADNVDQKRRLDALAEQANAKIEASGDLVALRQNTGRVPTQAERDPGKRLMDVARATIAEMEDEENRLLERRTQRARTASHFNISVIALGSLLGVIFLSVAGATVSREIGVSARARAQVNSLNADLERRVAQRTAALGESEGRLAGVIQSAMDSIITVDEEQRIVLFNGAAERLFRCPAAEALGQAITRFIPQRFHGAHAGHIRKFGDTGVTNRAMGPQGVLWAVRADGQEIQIEASISQVVTGGRKLFTVILRDVTERVRGEETRERLAAIVESSDDAIISKTLDGTITAWNRGAEKVFGYTSSEAVGKTMWMIMPPERAAEETEILARVGRGLSVEHFETIRVRKDGKKIDVSATISPIKNSSGVIVGASKIARDITERKRAEQRLRESQENYRTLFDSMDEGFCTIEVLFDENNDPVDYRFLEVNPAFEKHTGIPRARGQRMREIAPQHEEYWFEIYGKIASTGEPARFEKPAEQLHRWYDIHAFRIGEPREKKVAILFNDITERKRVEEALREQVQVMDSAQVFVRDMESRVVFWPRGAEKLYGFNSQEALGILSHDLFHTQFPEPLETIEKKLFDTGLWEGELIHRRRDGSIITVSSAWILHCDSQGRPVRILETNVDITARKQAAEKLAGQAEELSRQAEELSRSRQALESQTLMLQSVLDSMTEGLAAADEQGKFVIWNTAAEKILGMGATNLPNQEWTEHYGLFLNDTVTPFSTDQLPMVRAIRGEVSTTEMFVRNPVLPEGAWIEVSGGPLKDKHGVVRGGVTAFRDITRSRADEREIRKLNDELEIRVMERTAQLEVANKELEAFSYSVSHDLRAPLRHISGFSQMLVEEFGPTLDPGARHYLDRIQAGTQKMGLLVDELLNLARVGRHALNRQTTKLNELVAEVAAILQPESAGRQVEWVIADLPAMECDPVLVKQVFQNLLANALKFTRSRAHAVIEVRHQQEADGQTVFMIRDNGIGFNMKYVDKLFGVFQRLHRPEDFEGTGIGLATVQRIVHKHGGRVWAEAELDKGATFYFTLGVGKETENKSNGATAGGQS
jgi:PAS domain S-box-containing protein